MPQLERRELEDLARRALSEDLGEAGDITTKRIVRIDQPGRAEIVAKAEGILAGIPVAETVFHLVDKQLDIVWMASDGDRLEVGQAIAEIAGRARAILAGERVALNFLQHLSGVATLTSKFASICTQHGVRLLCTRKTIPGLRAVQRYAVSLGGGHLHRAGLYDAVLIKTNHERLSGGVSEAVRRAKANPNFEVEVEVETVEEIEEAIAAGADRILLDNADPATVKEAVQATKGRIYLEVSGGMTLKNIAAVARAKPDAISVGRITHSVEAVDMALRVLGPPSGAPR